MQEQSLARMSSKIEAQETDPLARVGAAVTTSDVLHSIADDLVGRFVEQAREAGCSWTQIGGALGVSKQAAQQRYPAAGQSLAPAFRADAQHALAAACGHAKELGHPHLGTEHILLALAGQHDSLAGQVLAGLDVTPAEVQKAIDEHAPRGAGPLATVGISSRVKRTLEQTKREASGHGHRCPGAEHLLLVLAADGDGAASRILDELGVTPERLRDTIAARLGPDAADLAHRPARPPRRLRRRR